MTEPHPIAQTLLALLHNQVTRTDAALQGLRDDVLRARPGHDCNSIEQIGTHMVNLRGFQLKLMNSPLVSRFQPLSEVQSVEQLHEALSAAAGLVRQEIVEHDPADWFAAVSEPRQGRWPEDPTLLRFVRPFNDYTNHLGSIRAIRRMLGNPAEQTQH